jgi:hypothetical protein
VATPVIIRDWHHARLSAFVNATRTLTRKFLTVNFKLPTIPRLLTRRPCFYLMLHAILGVVADYGEAKFPVTLGDLLEFYEVQAKQLSWDMTEILDRSH